MKIEVIHHASIKITTDKVIYFDPYKIDEELHDADYIFITHDHYDHYDPESIEKIRHDHTKIIVPICLKDKKYNLLVDGYRMYGIDDLKFVTVPSYNVNKDFHPREKYYVGYNILLNDKYYYIMGDTDATPEALNVKCDVCFVPIGGKFTMDYLEASDFINKLKPKKVVPIHYGMIVGDTDLGLKFKEKIDKEIEVRDLIGGENYD